MWNISGMRSNEAAGEAVAAAVEATGAAGPENAVAPSGGRQGDELKTELLNEMTIWSSGDRGVFKSWHRHALSLVHLHAITLLQMEGPVSMRRLAESMDVSDAGATGIVDRMEKRGLVERRRDSEDRRVVMVHLTDAGGRVFEDIAARRRERLSALLDQLSEEDLAAMLRGVRAIHAARQRLVDAAPGHETDTSPPPASG